jgi:hypothetical protein
MSTGPPCCEGQSFVSGTRYIAAMSMLGLVVLAWRNADHPLVAMLCTQATVYVLIAAAIVACGCWNMLHSHTRIDATHIRQGCRPLQRSVALADIVQLRLIRAPRFDPWVTPRVLQAVEALAHGPAEPRSRA